MVASAFLVFLIHEIRKKTQRVIIVHDDTGLLFNWANFENHGRWYMLISVFRNLLCCHILHFIHGYVAYYICYINHKWKFYEVVWELIQHHVWTRDNSEQFFNKTDTQSIHCPINVFAQCKMQIFM